MKKFAYSLVASFGADEAACADVPVHGDEVLSISEALVITGQGPAYYRNIRLAANHDGSLSLVEAEHRKLVHVHAIEVVLLESFPLQANVRVRGDMTVSCVALEEALVTREGSTFTVALAETPYDPHVQCVSGTTGFQISIPLDISGLKAGAYSVIVNGKAAGFRLDADNV